MRQNLLRRFLDRPPRLEGGLEVTLEPRDERHAWLRVRGPDHRFEASAATLSVPYPSGLRRLRAGDPEAEVVLIEHASRGFDQAAAEEEISYLDLRGRGRLMGPGFIYVAHPFPGYRGSEGGDVDDRVSLADQDALWRYESSKAVKTVSPFAPKASRIVRALLSEPTRRWRLSDVTDQVRMNPGNVHRVLASLSERGFVERDEDLYVLEDPGSLLEAWAEHAVRGRSRDRLMVPVHTELQHDVEQILEALGGAAVVSGELAAELYAPYLPAAHAVVHCVDERAWANGQRLDVPSRLRPLRAHGQVIVGLADEGVADYGEHRDGFPLVSPAQLYVDLSRERGRAREAAEHVRDEVLRF